ncbi:hypothetical protein JNO63_06840 [Anaerococcus sp. mt242]|uniref:hypothetical protein n=1 Tax=Anaerococcus sp. mt242 TaxID=2661917 RepID=UPI00193290F7|nr:hypothetical protein [Anaerococcus sp. mt242]MBM0046805.1 hypothetical protein [Anaerococcus sp. mt242]
MKSKLLALVLATSFVLTACGGEVTNATEKSKEETKVAEGVNTEEKEDTEESEKQEDSKKEIASETEDLEEDDDLYNPNNIGKTIEDPSIGKADVIKTGKDVENNIKIKDIDFSINSALLAHVTPEDEEVKALWGDETDIIVINFDIANNSDTEYTFYPEQSTITTNTKEQLDPDLLLSGGPGQFKPNTEVSGSVFYYPEKGLNEINEITLYLKSPYKDVSDGVDEEVPIKITFDENGKLISVEESK